MTMLIWDESALPEQKKGYGCFGPGERKNLEDARERLKETKILAPTKGIVGNVFTQEGEVIQGGKTTFTGGTLLATVLDMRRVIVGAEVDESDIEQVLKLAPGWAKPGTLARKNVASGE